MNSFERPRQPAGAPESTGGQWRQVVRHEAGIDLSDDRMSAIEAGEYTPATFTTEHPSPASGPWWDDHASVAEWGGEGAAFAKMPVDWTPGLTPGRADSGLRRTHRMEYRGNGFTLRMPSATSIRSFAATNKSAFDIPIDATDDHGRSITAWVRAVQHKPGHWSVSGLGFGGVTDAKVSEAVTSVLEARRPTRALRQAGDLIDKHRQRLADQGETLEPVRSGWIASVGYSDLDRIVMVHTRSRTNADGHRVPGRTYATQVPREVFEELRSSETPGAVYNKLVKGRPGQMVSSCGMCGRTYAASRTHDCPDLIANRSQPIEGLDESKGRRQALRGIRRRRSSRRISGPATRALGEPDVSRRVLGTQRFLDTLLIQPRS